MKLAFIFPGQGSQAIGMGKEFYENYSIAKELFDTASDILKIDMKNLLFEDNDNINKTQFTQPAILLVSYISYILFNKQNKSMPIFTLGHSLGEITANVVVNGISFENAISLVYKRGELMQKACDGLEAGMAVVMGLDDNILEDFCKQKENIWCANYNSDGQNVLAGLKKELLKAENEIKNLGAKRFLMLPMSVASHCPLLNSMCDEFKNILDNALVDNFTSEVISNATMESYKSKAKALELLTMQLTKPVFYKQSIQANQDRIDCFIEFGYGNVLKGLNKRLGSKPTYCVSNISSLESTLNEINK
ncbi:[acyl-carrier-protein] S-malonyltransferase [Helicobacter sp. 16-1353]|uniref:ACP S-malonyltransferase n=1 Tax=Helicobacter sp. 16-1353 TaxID=2004996 RepID=UPI000DCB8818|nr:ACP S-malonyltransferase [Helicobacter sp. 16-1353]RAX54086.1 [acyl-carrier-protein] S-malonyltransferase [Helicobacter sp. 16-1353]